MWWLIAALFVFGVLFVLYTIGKKVKKEEKELVEQYHTVRKKVERHNKFAKYSRKHYAKTPTIKK